MPTRRTFLQSLLVLPPALALGGAGRPEAKIKRVEIYALRYPMTGFFKFFTGPHGSRGRASVLVKLTAADGTTGWGQSVPIAKWSYETLETCTTVLRKYYSPLLIGRDPHDLAGIHATMDKAVAPGFSTGMPIARAGIDLALWDLIGRLADKNVAELWGRKAGGKLTLSWTVNARTLQEVEGIMAAGRKRGYRHFNIKVGPDPDYDVKLATLVRKGAPDGFLWADANGGYEPAVALGAAPRLAEAGVDVLEAPIKPNRIRGWRALVRQNALPIYMDEGVVSPVDLEEFIALGMLHGVAQKPARCGGLTSCRAQIELLRAKGLGWLGSGLTDPDVSMAAALILYSAYGLKKPAALNGPQFLTASLLAKPLTVQEGAIQVPTGPGLGVEVDEARVRDLAGKSR